MVAVTTSPPTCSPTTMRATGWSSATASSPPTRSKPPVAPWPIAPSARSRSSRRPDMTVDDRFIRREADEDEELLGTRNEIITGPVTDWATDFSHLEPEWSADPYPIQDDLRQRCPIAHTDR